MTHTSIDSRRGGPEKAPPSEPGRSKGAGGGAGGAQGYVLVKFALWQGVLCCRDALLGDRPEVEVMRVIAKTKKDVVEYLDKENAGS